MSLAGIHVGDYGHSITLTFLDIDTGSAADISAYTTGQSMTLEDPAGVQSSVTAAFVTDGTDGQIDYTVASGLFDQAGVWYIRGVVTAASGQLATSWRAFSVAA